MNENRSPIPSRLYNAAKGGHVAGTADIIDDDKGKTQDVINKETDSALENRYTKEETYSKTELNNLITTPSQEYVTVVATDETTDVTDILPATGAADTIYRVGSWDGSQYDASVYSEYSWNGSGYQFLSKKQYGVDDKPTAGSDNLVKSGGVFEKELISLFTNENITSDHIKDTLCGNISIGNFTIYKDITGQTLLASKTYYIYVYLSDYDIQRAVLSIRNGDTIYYYNEIISSGNNAFKIQGKNIVICEFTPSADISNYRIQLQKNSESIVFCAVTIYDKKEILDATEKDLGNIAESINNFAIGLKWLNGYTDGGNNIIYNAEFLTAYFNQYGTYKIQYNDDKYQLYCRKGNGAFNEVSNNEDITFTEGVIASISVTDRNTSQIPLVEDLDLTISKLNLNKNEINISLENGVFDGGGGDVASSDCIRTQKIDCSEVSTIIVICPETMDILGNFETSYQQRINFKYFINAGVSISNPTGFVRFLFRRRNGSALQMSNLTEEERNGIRVFTIKGKNDVKLAAYNSSSAAKAKADIICTDANAQFILNACISCIGNIHIKLAGGTYNLYKLFYDNFGNACTLKTQDCFYNITNEIKLSYPFNSPWMGKDNAVIEMTQECFALCDSTTKTSMLLVPCRSSDGVSIYPLSRTYIYLEGLYILGYDYTKPIIMLDLAFSQATGIQYTNIRCDKYELDNGASEVHSFRVTPHIGCIGCRVGFGSNDGIKNNVKSVIVWYVGKGISCSGEHYVFEDVLTHHCYIGWAFGDYHTTGHFEHPNVMIGCSIEGCYRLMYLTKGGITTEGEFTPDSNNNLIASTLVCIGLSTEEVWRIPTEEEIEGQPVTARTLPILEVLKGAYRGRIELDYLGSNIFENGSGRAFTWRQYKYGQTVIGHGNTIDETYG